MTGLYRSEHSGRTDTGKHFKTPFKGEDTKNFHAKDRDFSVTSSIMFNKKSQLNEEIEYKMPEQIKETEKVR